MGGGGVTCVCVCVRVPLSVRLTSLACDHTHSSWLSHSHYSLKLAAQHKSYSVCDGRCTKVSGDLLDLRRSLSAVRYEPAAREAEQMSSKWRTDNGNQCTATADFPPGVTGEIHTQDRTTADPGRDCEKPSVISPPIPSDLSSHTKPVPPHPLNSLCSTAPPVASDRETMQTTSGNGDFCQTSVIPMYFFFIHYFRDH